MMNMSHSDRTEVCLMTQNEINKILLEDLTEQFVRKIQFDPQRSIRKLADLGERLAHGQALKKFFETAQRLLERRDSPYYAFVQRICAGVDLNTLKTLGVNLGLNSWSQLRQRRNMPWSLAYYLSGAPGSLTREELRASMQEGMSLGIRSFLLAPDESYGPVDGLIHQLHAFPDCAFGLFTSGAALSDDAIDQAAETHNLLISLRDTPLSPVEPVASALHSRRCPFALHTVYRTIEDARHILEGSWMQRVSRLSPLAFCIPDRNCPPDTRRTVQAYIDSLRENPRYPTLVIELLSDLLLLTQTLGSSRMVTVQADGTVNLFDGNHALLGQHNLRCAPLTDILTAG